MGMHLLAFCGLWRVHSAVLACLRGCQVLGLPATASQGGNRPSSRPDMTTWDFPWEGTGNGRATDNWAVAFRSVLLTAAAVQIASSVVQEE